MKKIKIDSCPTRSKYRIVMGYLQILDYCCICGAHISTRGCDDDGYIWKEGEYHECEECD